MKYLHSVSFLILFAIQANSILKKRYDHLSKSITYNDTLLELPNCEKNNCVNGICISDNICECHSRYSYINNQGCTYSRKIKIVALLLELFCPFGASYFYLELYKIGILKFGFVIIYPLMLLICFCQCIAGSHNKININIQNIVGYVFYFSYILGFIAWYVYDVIILSIFNRKDGNNIYLTI